LAKACDASDAFLNSRCDLGERPGRHEGDEDDDTEHATNEEHEQANHGDFCSESGRTATSA
jgi:hypothetical protein